MSAPTYATAHKRLRAFWGPAADYTCTCGQPAQSWAYDGSDPNELTGRNGVDVLTYSLDPLRYAPLCWVCHHRQDRERRAA